MSTETSKFTSILGTTCLAKSLHYMNPKCEVPSTLWHYTKADSLVKILQSKKMYATHYEYLNDPSEGKLFIELTQEIAKDNLDTLPQVIDVQNAKTIDDYKSLLWREINNLVTYIYREFFYIICFSKKGDLLSQWRAYGDNCNGYSIGINSKAFPTKPLFDDGSRFYLYPVIYEPSDQKTFVENLLKFFVDKVAIELDQTDNEDKECLVTLSIDELQHILADFTLVMKPAEYKDEQEWRLIYRVEKRQVEGIKESEEDKKIDVVELQPVGSKLVPRVLVDMSNEGNFNPFTHIYLGPKKINNEKQETYAIDMITKKHCSNSVEVLCSKIPVRD